MMPSIMKMKILIATALFFAIAGWTVWENGAVFSDGTENVKSISQAQQPENGADPSSFSRAQIECDAPVATAENAFPREAIECDDAATPDAEEINSKITGLASEIPVSDQEKDSDSNVVAGVVEKGDTVSKILENASAGETGHYITAMKKVFSPGSFRQGQPYTVVTDPDSGDVIRFEYEINDLRRLVVEGRKNPQARLENIQYKTVLEACAGIIEDNLFQAVADAGENPQLAVRLATLFGSEINFVKDLQQGDSFVVLHEKKYRNGHYAGYGRILAARFTNKGKTWEAFLFRDATGKDHYYNAKGENLKKTLLQAPLAVTRLTSKFSHNRKHPILGTSRPHLGVDYGAPTGTPVKAVGDGVVTSRGRNGGYGNQVIINHGGGLESLYAHLSKFSSGLKPGQKVRQGQVIGYVGSTGLSTGPHLDFRLRQNGMFLNPTKAINPRGAPVSARFMTAFAKTVAQERKFLDGHRLPRDYAIDMLIPQNVASGEIDELNDEGRATVKKERQKRGRAKTNRSAKRRRSRT